MNESSRDETLRSKVQRLRDELRRPDLSRSDKLAAVAQRLISAAHADDTVKLVRTIAYQLERPPAVFRGLRDLAVRRATSDDEAGLTRVEQTPARLVRERFARGDLAFVGLLGSEILCHAWFHRGPVPFEEDACHTAVWALDDATFWSYAAAAKEEAQASGVFVKVFQTALRALLTDLGGARVQCMVRYNNSRSVLLHDRLGFERLGVMTAVVSGPFRALRWSGRGGTRHWLPSPGRRLIVPLPPDRAAAGARAAQGGVT